MKTIKLLLAAGAIAVIFLNLSKLASAQPCATCPGSGSRMQSSGQALDNSAWEAYFRHRSANEDWQAGRWEQAVAKYRSIIKTYPSTPQAGSAHLKVGLYLKYHAQFDEAIQEFQRGILLCL